MKFRYIRLLMSAAATLAFAVVSPQLSPLQAQGTAFTYQGQLLSTNGPAHGTYNLTFALYNAGSGGSQFGSTVQTNGVVISNGLFTVTVDFGAGIFTGTAYWLQIGVETNGAGSFTALTARQQLTPTPYSIYSEGGNAAGLTGTIPSGDLSGAYSGIIDLNNASDSFSGNGAGLNNVNATALDGLTPANFWQTTGNAGTTPGPNYVGTTDGKALELNPNGTVGVGTPTPAGRLDVEGRPGADGDSIYVLNGYPNGNGIVVNATNGTDAFGLWAFSSGPGVVVNSTGVGVSSTSTADGVDANGDGAGSIGVSGTHNTSTGTAAGVQGMTYSTDASANGVYGAVQSGNPGGTSAGVMGQNNGTNYSGYGVYGSQNGSGSGVYGYTPSGSGVFGYSPNGYGVEGESGGSIGVFGESDTYIGVYGYSSTYVGGYFFSDSSIGVEAFSDGGDGIDGYSYDTNSIGIYGEHSESGGTAAGVEGLTYSQDGSAKGVYGVVESTSPGGFSTAVWGQNNGTSGSGIGVYGTQNGSGWGVYGYTPSGIGVLAASGTGTGLSASSGSGTGISASSSSGTGISTFSSSGSALTIASGAIHVSGASTNSTATAAFTQVATASNIGGDATIINNSLCNGDPNAILIVTPNWNPRNGPANYWSHVVGVYYTGSQWAIFNEDTTTMPAGPAFNVLIIKN